MEVYVIDIDTSKFEEEFDIWAKIKLEEIGQHVENNAFNIVPVKTGNLRDSLSHYVDENEYIVWVYSEVRYAPFVEYGTRKMVAKPYLRPAVIPSELYNIVNKQ